MSGAESVIRISLRNLKTMLFFQTALSTSLSSSTEAGLDNWDSLKSLISLMVYVVFKEIHYREHSDKEEVKPMSARDFGANFIKATSGDVKHLDIYLLSL